MKDEFISHRLKRIEAERDSLIKKLKELDNYVRIFVRGGNEACLLRQKLLYKPEYMNEVVAMAVEFYGEDFFEKLKEAVNNPSNPLDKPEKEQTK